MRDPELDLQPLMLETETGDLVVLGSGHRASAGVKRGYVTDMKAATYAIRDAVERAEKNAGTSVQSVWIACAGAGLKSKVSKVEIEIYGEKFAATVHADAPLWDADNERIRA